MKTELKYFKTRPDAIEPSFGTEHSACFDLSACFSPGDAIKGCYQDITHEQRVHDMGCLVVEPYNRVLVPTGLIVDLDPMTSMRIYSRSGLAFKRGLRVFNGVGVVDADYKQEVFVMIYNDTDTPQLIKSGDRIAQAEIVPRYECVITEITQAPQETTSRSGGFGSTGVSS